MRRPRLGCEPGGEVRYSTTRLSPRQESCRDKAPADTTALVAGGLMRSVGVFGLRRAFAAATHALHA
jgi:hypothetical protein